MQLASCNWMMIEIEMRGDKYTRDGREMTERTETQIVIYEIECSWIV